MSVRVGLGLSNFPFSGARALWRWVDLCEQSPVDSLWQTERLVGNVPYLEPIAFLGALAGATERLKFGMSVSVVTHRDPLILAKECATIDYLSGGRLLPAFGVGNERAPEWRALGQDPGERGARADEILEIATRLWTEDRVDFAGKFYRYTGACIEPKPVQKPLPLWIGGSSPAAIRRTARLGTGWIAGIQSPAQVAPVVEAIRKRAVEAGRPIDPDHYGAGFSFRFGSWDEPLVDGVAKAFARFPGVGEPRAVLAVGDADAIVRRVEEYRAAGISKFVLRPIAVGDHDFLDQTRRLIAEVIPRVHT
jgi:probable F420-dependent oxidoreductase